MDCDQNIDRIDTVVLYRNSDDDLMCEATFSSGKKVHGKVLNINPFPNDTHQVSKDQYIWNVDIKWQCNEL